MRWTRSSRECSRRARWRPAFCWARCRSSSAAGERAFGRSTAALQKVADRIAERRDAYVVFETTNALKEGKVLRALVRQAKVGKRGGLGRLVRPRNAGAARVLTVGDDEQEE